MANANGWLDMGAGLARKTHFFRDGIAICSHNIQWGKNRLQQGSEIPGPNSCMTCLVAFFRDQDE